jgi:hypothetical protein
MICETVACTRSDLDDFFTNARSFTPQQYKNHSLYKVKPFWEERRKNIQRAKADADARDAREAAEKGIVLNEIRGWGLWGMGAWG